MQLVSDTCVVSSLGRNTLLRYLQREGICGDLASLDRLDIKAVKEVATTEQPDIVMPVPVRCFYEDVTWNAS